jgi:hypothetical protein
LACWLVISSDWPELCDEPKLLESIHPTNDALEITYGLEGFRERATISFACEKLR